MSTQNPITLSGIQPSNALHLGNYLGAVRNWLAMQERYRCYFMMVDLHAVTQNPDPAELRASTYRGIATYLAAGLDPAKVTLFVQSHVPQHAELAWILTCSSYMGELGRMTQYKDKSQNQGANISAGLLCYPSLMAADILLYQPAVIPVGEDQKQHVELTRNLAERCNNRWQQPVFRVPEPLIQGSGARVMDLQTPERKMSKSATNPKGVLFLSDSDKQLTKKVKAAVTDSGNEVVVATASPGLRNLCDLYAALTAADPAAVLTSFAGWQYGKVKETIAEAVVAEVGPLRAETERLLADQTYLDQVLAQGAQKAQEAAAPTLAAVYDALGFIPAHRVVPAG